jgi:hypothetical protein
LHNFVYAYDNMSKKQTKKPSKLSQVKTKYIMSVLLGFVLLATVACTGYQLGNIYGKQSAIAAINSQDAQTVNGGHIAGASTAKMPNYFDGPGKTSANVANEVGNTFLIGGSIMFAVLLGIVLLVRSMAILSR